MKLHKTHFQLTLTNKINCRHISFHYITRLEVGTYNALPSVENISHLVNTVNIASDFNDLDDDVFAAPRDDFEQYREKELESPLPHPPSISTHPLFSSAHFHKEQQASSMHISGNLTNVMLLSSPKTEYSDIHPLIASNLHLTRNAEEPIPSVVNTISHNPVFTVLDNSNSSEEVPAPATQLASENHEQIFEGAKRLLPHEMEYICKVAPTELDLSLDSAVASSIDTVTPDEITEDISVPKAIYICSKPAMIAVEKAIQHSILTSDISIESEVVSETASSGQRERDSKSPIPTLIISEVPQLQPISGPSLERGLKSQDSLEIPTLDDRNSFEDPIRLANESKPNLLEIESVATEEVNLLLENSGVLENLVNSVSENVKEEVVQVMSSIGESNDFVLVTDEEVLKLKQEEQDEKMQSAQAIPIVANVPNISEAVSHTALGTTTDLEVISNETSTENRVIYINRIAIPIEDEIIKVQDINTKENEIPIEVQKQAAEKLLIDAACEPVNVPYVVAAPIHSKSSVTTAIDILHENPTSQTITNQAEIVVEANSDSSALIPMLLQFENDQDTNTTNHTKQTNKPLIIEQMFKNPIVRIEEESPADVRRHTNEDGDLPGITRYQPSFSFIFTKMLCFFKVP